MGSRKEVGVVKMTIEEAKEFYRKYNCSHYFMAREELPKYKLYQELNIDKSLEREWRLEMIDELADCLKGNRDINECSPLYADAAKRIKINPDIMIYNRIYDLAVSFHDKDRLELMIELIDYVKIKSVRNSLSIAGTIIGRKILSARSGMIFWAYDIGEKDDAVALIKKALMLTDVETDDEREAETARNARKTIREIIDMLGLSKDVFSGDGL